MKKTILIVLAILASASFNVATSAKGKDKKNKGQAAATQPVELKTSSDTPTAQPARYLRSNHKFFSQPCRM